MSSSPSFGDFKAYPVTSGNSLYTAWSFGSFDESSYIPQDLYIYVTPYNDTGAGNTISAPVVVPLRDLSGNLTTEFTIDNNTEGMSFDIENGVEYQLLAQLVYINTTNSDSVESVNSIQSIVVCSTIPETPNFECYPATNAFVLKLLNNNVPPASPTSVSPFDGYGVLKGIFLTYADKTKLFSQFIANDASNTLYTREIITDVSLNEYEVSIASYNYNSTTAPNGKKVAWGGRSANSQSQVVVVNDRPGPVKNLQVYESMADVSANLQPNYNYVSNTIKWEIPDTGATPDNITGYNVYRDGTRITQVDKTDYSYIDNASILQVGQVYTYNVTATNSNGEGTKNSTGVSIKAVIFPTQTLFTVDPSGDEQLALKVTNGPNGFNNYLFDFSSNVTTGGYQSSNPFLVSSLTDGVEYFFTVSTQASSVNKQGTIYKTSYWTPLVSGKPYNPTIITNPSNIQAYVLDPSSVPTGTVKLSWINATSNNDFSANMIYRLESKLAGSPDASYVLQHTASCISGESSEYTFPSGVLRLGSSYDFRVKNIENGTGADAGKKAESGYSSVIQAKPFVVPGPVRNLTLFNPTTTDFSYSFLAPLDNGGLNLQAYRAKLYLLNDGSNVLLDTQNNVNDVSGNLSTIFPNDIKQGSQYKLVVESHVSDASLNTTDFYGQEVSTINFTKPAGLNGPDVVNASNGSLLNGIQINWATNVEYNELDASNVVFKIYSNGGALPLATGVSGTSYLDETPIIGSIHDYQVVPVVNGVAASYVPGVTPTPTAEIVRLHTPAQATDLHVSDITINSVTLNWTASIGGSGNDASLNYLWTLTDASNNIDASGVTLDTSVNVINLDDASVYTFKVKCGVQNPADNEIFYNDTSVPEYQFGLYGQVPKPGDITLYSSFNALLANLSDAVDVSGLVFSHYRLEVATDASFINDLKTYNTLYSEFYIPELTQGNRYFVRVTNVYKNIINDSILSPVSNTKLGIPTISPSQPTGLSASTNSQNSITVYWDIPVSNANTPNPDLYAVNFGTDPSNVIQGLSFDRLNDFSNNGTQYYKTITNLSYGKIYYMNVVAGIQILESIAVSQPSRTVTAVPYNKPGAPTNFQNFPGSTTIKSKWSAPSDAGGAGQGSNSPLYYRLEVATDLSFVNNLKVQTEILANEYTTLDLALNTDYYCRVKSYFKVQNNINTLSESDYVTSGVIKTQREPTAPSLTELEATNTATTGREVKLQYSIDPSFSGNWYLRRQIYSPSDVKLSDYTQTNTASFATNNQYIDITDVPGTGNDNIHFLNGNKIQYILDVSYDIANGDDIFLSSQPSAFVVPYGRPIPTDQSGNAIDLSQCIVPLDLSGSEYSQFKFRINKNGSDVNSLVAVGLSNQGEAYVLNPTNPGISYSNVQIDGKIAENQYGEIIMEYGVNVNMVDNTMVIASNSGGALVAKQPSNGAFGPDTTV